MVWICGSVIGIFWCVDLVSCVCLEFCGRICCGGWCGWWEELVGLRSGGLWYLGCEDVLGGYGGCCEDDDDDEGVDYGGVWIEDCGGYFGVWWIEVGVL